MNSRAIIVCGYPKSGTTWLSRLVAELLDCPLRGNWGFDQGTKDTEGLDRDASFECFKSHHQYSELEDAGCWRIIYIIRDPRDVAISASHHFRIPFPRVSRLISRLPGGRRLRGVVTRWIHALLPASYRLRVLADAVLHGNSAINRWLETPWRDHYRPFKANGMLIVRFEDLVDDAQAVCRTIAEYLEVPVAAEAATSAVLNQSFEVKKRSFEEQGLRAQANFLRAGGYGYWRREWTARQNHSFVESIAEDLAVFSYAID